MVCVCVCVLIQSIDSGVIEKLNGPDGALGGSSLCVQWPLQRASPPFLSLMPEEFWVLVCETTEKDKAGVLFRNALAPTPPSQRELGYTSLNLGLGEAAHVTGHKLNMVEKKSMLSASPAVHNCASWPVVGHRSYLSPRSGHHRMAGYNGCH